MQTILNQTLKEIDDVNDQLCFSAFSQYEVLSTLQSLATMSPDLSTIEAFPSNPFSQRIFRKAEELPSFASQTAETAIRMAVTYSYEHLATYVTSVLDFRANHQASDADILDADAIEDKLAQRAEFWMNEKPERCYFKTMGFVRILRNSFGHAHAVPSQQLSSYVRNHAHALNEFWEGQPANLGNFDFKTVTGNNLSFESAFTLISFIRICLHEFDAMIASTLDSKQIVSEALSKVWAENGNLRGNTQRIASKTAGLLEQEYGWRPNAETLSNAISEFCG